MSAPQQPVTADESAAILRLHHVEGWPVGTIADQPAVIWIRFEARFGVEP